MEDPYQRGFMPSYKVRDNRDVQKRTWRILSITAVYDKTTIVLQDVEDRSKITADFDELAPHLELVCKSKRSA